MGRSDGAGLNFGRCPVTDTSGFADGWILKRVQDDGGFCKMTGLQDVGVVFSMTAGCSGGGAAFGGGSSVPLNPDLALALVM